MEPDSESSARHERLFDERNYSDKGWSYFKKKPVILTYGLLALSYILVIALFIKVLPPNSMTEKRDVVSKSDLLSLNSTVAELATKMKEIEQGVKKATTCDIGWELFQDSCYYFSNIKSNWMKARSKCVVKHGDLVVITSAKEQMFLSAKTRDTFYWIGLNDIEEVGKWTWVDGTPYASSYKAWLPNEPNDGRNSKDCAHMWMGGKWNNKLCTHDDIFFICEKKL